MRTYKGNQNRPLSMGCLNQTQEHSSGPKWVWNPLIEKMLRVQRSVLGVEVGSSSGTQFVTPDSLPNYPTVGSVNKNVLLSMVYLLSGLTVAGGRTKRICTFKDICFWHESSFFLFSPSIFSMHFHIQSARLGCKTFKTASRKWCNQTQHKKWRFSTCVLFNWQ